MKRLALGLSVLGACGASVACGGGDTAQRPTTEGTLPPAPELRRQLEQATRSRAEDFPPVAGRTLQQVADDLGAAGPELALATSVVTPGASRLAFGLIDKETGFLYGPTAVYVARGPNRTAVGPFAAPADLLLTDPPFRSRQAATEDDAFAAIYESTPRFERPGEYAVLAVTRIGDRLVGSGGAVKVTSTRADEVPDVGEPAPRVKTDTAAASGINSVETRVPPDDMHDEQLTDLLGRKPVALIFATPQLCASRVCGPVVDIALQLKQEYGDRIAFIHQEVYVDNDVSKGLRSPLRAFNLPTEPWLFTIDREGRVASRLEGSFGFRAMKDALDAALRS